MSTESIERIEHKELVFAKLQPHTPVDVKDLQAYDGLIIEYTNRQSVFDLINRIRSHEDEEVYLLPIFLSKFFREPNQNVARLVDGTIPDTSDLAPIAAKTHQIKDRL